MSTIFMIIILSNSSHSVTPMTSLGMCNSVMNSTYQAAKKVSTMADPKRFMCVNGNTGSVEYAKED